MAVNTSGEVADLMVKEGIQITESAAKLAGLGAKNLAAILVAVIRDEGKLQGKTNLKQLLKSEKPLCVLQVKKSDLGKFNAEAKKYGVLFTTVSEKDSSSELCDIVAKQDDIPTLNYIIEKLGYAAPEVEETKKPQPRPEKNPSEKKSVGCGASEKTDKATKPSVRAKVADIKARQERKPKIKNKEKTKLNLWR